MRGPPGTTWSACTGAPAAASTASASALASKASTLRLPVAQLRPAPLNLGEAAAHAARRRLLVLGAVAEENLADLEQRRVGIAAVGVALRRGDEAGNDARPHVRELGRDRVRKRELRLAAAEQHRCRMRDERPGHRLDEAAHAERAPRLAGADLQRREHRLARGFAALERRQRHGVDADDAHDLLDEVGGAVHVGAPGRER